MKKQGMEFLLSSAIFHYGKKGFHSMHLGGGHNINEKDGLSFFKMKFADNKLDFYCSKIVCNKKLYEEEVNSKYIKNKEFFLISKARG